MFLSVSMLTDMDREVIIMNWGSASVCCSFMGLTKAVRVT